MGEVVGVELGRDRGDRRLHPREDPAVLDRDRMRSRRAAIHRGETLALRCIDVQQDQPARIPELVGEVGALLDLGVGVAHVLGR